MEKSEYKPVTLLSGKRVFLSPTGDCALFNEDFDYYCFENGLGAVLDPDGVHAPRKPVDELRRQRRNAMRRGDEKIIRSYYDRLDTWTSKIVRIMGLYRQCVHQDIWLHIQQTVRNYEERTLSKFFQIRAEVNTTYGGYTIAKGLDNFRRIQAVPVFTSTSSVSYGVAALAKLFKERVGWGNYQQIYRDDTKIPILREKMSHWEKLEYVLDQVDENNETYEQLVRRLLRKNQIMITQENAIQIKEAGEKQVVDRYLAKKESERIEGINKALAMHTVYRSDMETSMQKEDEQQWSKFDSTNLSENNDEMQLVNRGDDLYHFVPIAQVAAWMICHNCGGQHMVKNCTIPYCLQCNKSWASVKSQGYHNALHCPNNPMDLRHKPSGKPVDLAGRGIQKQSKMTGRVTDGRGIQSSLLSKRSGDAAGISAKRPVHVNFMPPVAHHALVQQEEDVEYDYNEMEINQKA